MTSLTQSYLDNADRFSAVVDAAGDWAAQSPCSEWTAAQVVDHVVSTQRGYLTKQGATLGDLPEGDPGRSWHTHLDEVRTTIADESFATREFDGYFGRTTVDELLANFYGFDMLVHRWDLGAAVGAHVTFADDELDRLETAMDGLGDMLYSDGVCKPALAVPDDAPRQQKLLGRLGRQG
ncbi:MAG: maleylpyruvate isomerase N-terminal domain-containing protein [Marmoricola sp.]